MLNLKSYKWHLSSTFLSTTLFSELLSSVCHLLISSLSVCAVINSVRKCYLLPVRFERSVSTLIWIRISVLHWSRYCASTFAFSLSILLLYSRRHCLACIGAENLKVPNGQRQIKSFALVPFLNMCTQKCFWPVLVAYGTRFLEKGRKLG